MEKDVMLCCCYIPPKDSLYFDPDTFSNLESDVKIFKKNFFIILGGYFNARTGIEKDRLTRIANPLQWMTCPSLITRRREKIWIISLTTMGNFYSKCVNHWISGC